MALHLRMGSGLYQRTPKGVHCMKGTTQKKTLCAPHKFEGRVVWLMQKTLDNPLHRTGQQGREL